MPASKVGLVLMILMTTPLLSRSSPASKLNYWKMPKPKFLTGPSVRFIEMYYNPIRRHASLRVLTVDELIIQGCAGQR